MAQTKATELDHVDRWLEQILDETLEEHGLSTGEYHVLGKLVQTPSGRRSAGDLAAKVELSSAAMTNRLDRLEKAGLVLRIPDEHDRRSVQIEVTQDGRRLYERAVGAQAAKEAIVAEALTPRQQDE